MAQGLLGIGGFLDKFARTLLPGAASRIDQKYAETNQDMERQRVYTELMNQQIRERQQEMAMLQEAAAKQAELERQQSVGRNKLRAAASGGYEPGALERTMLQYASRLPTETNMLLKLSGQGGGALPADIQVAEWYRNASPDQRAAFDKTKRGPPGVTVFNSPGTGFGTVPRTGGTPTYFKTPEELAETTADAAARTEREKTIAGKTAEAEFNLPSALQKVDAAIDIIGKLESHPGLKGVVGMPAPTKYWPGSPEKGFQALLEQAQGQVFLEAFESLKGGGQITQIEGTKAQQAKARLQEAQSEKDFLTALKDYKDALLEGRRILAKKAGSGAKPPPPAPGEVRKGYRFRGGNPADPLNWVKVE